MKENKRTSDLKICMTIAYYVEKHLVIVTQTTAIMSNQCDISRFITPIYVGIFTDLSRGYQLRLPEMIIYDVDKTISATTLLALHFISTCTDVVFRYQKQIETQSSKRRSKHESISILQKVWRTLSNLICLHR